MFKCSGVRAWCTGRERGRGVEFDDEFEDEDERTDLLRDRAAGWGHKRMMEVQGLVRMNGVRGARD